MNTKLYELKKLGNAVRSIAKASAALRIAGDIDPVAFPEDPGDSVGILEGLEFLGGRVSDLVDEMESQAVIESNAIEHDGQMAIQTPEAIAELMQLDKAVDEAKVLEDAPAGETVELKEVRAFPGMKQRIVDGIL